MAKEPVQLADSFGIENTGGMLSGLLADENPFDRSSLLRLGSWGGVSVAAVIVALYSSQSSMALRREQVAAVDVARQAQQIQSVARENQNETRRLASAIDTLNGDRDRLYTRVTVLEQGLDSVTGAITRQATASPSAAAAPATTAPAATVPPAATEPETEAAPSPTAVLAPAPAVTPVATTAAKTTEKPDKPPAEKAPAKVATAAPKAPPPPAVMPAPLVAAKSIMAPPDAAATKLIEPEKPEKLITSAPMPDVVASAPPADDAEAEAAETPPPKVAVQRTEFGVDMGGANSLGGLRALWRGLLKSRSNAVLTALRPIIVIRERSNGLGMQLRLVAGPLSDAAAAAKICAGLIENDRTCETAVFDGQRLVMNPGEPNAAADRPVADEPAAAKPAAAKPFVYRRGYSRRAANGEPARKPDPASTFSSFFSRR